MKPTTRQPITRTLTRLQKSYRQDRSRAQAYEALQNYRPVFKEQLETVAEMNDVNPWDPQFDSVAGDTDDRGERLLNIAIAGGDQALSNSLNRMVNVVTQHHRVDPVSISEGVNRLGQFANELGGAINRYSPELHSSPAKLAHAIREHGPLGAIYEAANRNPQTFMDDVEAGVIEREVLDGALHYSRENPVEPELGEPVISARDAKSMTTDELEELIETDARERLGDDYVGRSSIGPIDRPGEMPIDDLKKLIDDIAERGNRDE